MAKVYERNGVFHCSIRNPEGGSPVRRSLGIPAQKDLKAQAEVKASQLEVKIYKDSDPLNRTEKRLYDEMMAIYVQVCPDSHLYNIKTLTRFFAGKPAQPKPSDIAAYKRCRAAMGIADSTVRRELSVLSKAINHLIFEEGWRLENIVIGRKPSPGQPRVRWISPDQARRLYLAAKDICEQLGWFVIIGLSTGMRKQEIFDFPSKAITDYRLEFDPDDHKGNRYAGVPISLVAAHAKEQVKFTTREIRKKFARACKNAGITDFTPHDLRHTFASWMVQRGVPLIEVKEHLRHRSVKLTEIYAHLDPNYNAHYMHTPEYRPGQGLLIVDKIVANQVLNMPKLVELSGIEPLTSTLPVLATVN